MDKPCSYCICDCDKSCVFEIQEKAHRQGREDAFKEIAYSDSVIKEPFETLAYEKGKTDGAREFAVWLAHWIGYSKEWAELELASYEKEQKGTEE